MKLLFDQNISFRVIKALSDVFTGCAQVRQLGLENSSDIEIWEFAKQNHFSIVTFDADFYDISTLKGHPPKIIWLRIGNTSTDNLRKLMVDKKEIIEEFLDSDKYKDITCLEIE